MYLLNGIGCSRAEVANKIGDMQERLSKSKITKQGIKKRRVLIANFEYEHDVSLEFDTEILMQFRQDYPQDYQDFIYRILNVLDYCFNITKEAELQHPMFHKDLYEIYYEYYQHKYQKEQYTDLYARLMAEFSVAIAQLQQFSFLDEYQNELKKCCKALDCDNLLLWTVGHLRSYSNTISLDTHPEEVFKQLKKNINDLIFEVSYREKTLSKVPYCMKYMEEFIKTINSICDKYKNRQNDVLPKAFRKAL